MAGFIGVTTSLTRKVFGAMFRASLLAVFMVSLSAISFWVFLASAASIAQAFRAEPLPAFVVDDDPGGKPLDYLLRISRLSISGQRVEIRGRCDSACTMYLGLENVCVHPGAILGFHGPVDTSGHRSEMLAFEVVSRTAAAFYPVPIRDAYMREWRYLDMDLRYISGISLVSAGVKPCIVRGRGVERLALARI